MYTVWSYRVIMLEEIDPVTHFGYKSVRNTAGECRKGQRSKQPASKTI